MFLNSRFPGRGLTAPRRRVRSPPSMGPPSRLRPLSLTHGLTETAFAPLSSDNLFKEHPLWIVILCGRCFPEGSCRGFPTLGYEEYSAHPDRPPIRGPHSPKPYFGVWEGLPPKRHQTARGDPGIPTPLMGRLPARPMPPGTTTVTRGQVSTGGQPNQGSGNRIPSFLLLPTEDSPPLCSPAPTGLDGKFHGHMGP